MLLTIKQPTQHAYKSFHDYTPPTPPSASRFSPAIPSTGPSYPSTSTNPNKSLPPLPVSQSGATQQQMSTPHRGLPPPAAMTLPQPSQQPASVGHAPLGQSMGQLPAPPQQWQGAEESMRNWLHAKAEEDKRKQEEEKTRQESLRLEQRKIEQDMLRTSLNGGIPPYMIPMVFAGMGGGNLPNASLEWAQHYMAQTHHQQVQIQQQQLLPAQAHTSPEQIQRRDSRVFAPPQTAPLTLPSTPIGQSTSQSAAGFVPSHPMSPRARPQQSSQGASISRPTPSSHLPRINTGEVQIQSVPQQTSHGHPLQQTQTVQQEAQSSPSIYFHHWQPPTSQSTANAPTTPSDQTASPKKRKATGPQQPAPPPTSQPQYSPPPYSQGSSSVSNTPQGRRRGHSRQRSDVSSRGFDYSRSNRQRQNESSFASQSVTSPISVSERAQTPAESRPHSGGSNSVSSILQHSDRGSQSQQQPHHPHPHASPRFSAGPEMRPHEQQRATPEGDGSQRGHVIKRDDTRD